MSGAVQKAGGDVTNTVVTPAQATASSTLADHAGRELYVQDFKADSDVTTFINADTKIAGNNHTSVIKIAPNTVLTGDNSDALAAANKSIVIGNNSEFKNFRRKQVNAEYLPTPYMFSPNVRPEHLIRFHLACASGTARVAVMGDSIPSIGDNLISTSDHPMYAWIDELKKQNPGVDIQFKNCAIGGKTWGDMWNDSSQPPAWFDNDKKLNWKQFVCDYNPDLLLLYSGGNDGYGFDCVAMQNLMAYFKTASNFSSGATPSIILGCTYQPSLGSAVNSYNQTVIQNGIDFCSTYIRNYALSNNYGFLDFARWHAMCRDGIDIREQVMERVQPVAGTTLPAYAQAVATTNNTWAFPIASTGNGVSAQSCTSWLVNFSVDKDFGSLEVPLSDASGNPLTPTKNPLFIVNDNGKVKVTYCDGVIRDVIAQTSDIAWPTSGSSWCITCKDSRLKVDVQQPLDNGWGITDNGAHVMGMGYVTIFDHDVARFGSPYTPGLFFGNDVNITIHNLCVADNTQIYGSGHRGSCQRYRPIISDYEIYVESDNEYGGSGSYHLNAYGYRIIMAPVFRAVNWAVPNFGYTGVAGLHSTDNISTSACVQAAGLGFFNNSWIGASNYNATGSYLAANNGAGQVVSSQAGGGVIQLISHNTTTGADTVGLTINSDNSITVPATVKSSNQWVDFQAALQVENWIKAENFITATGSISMFGADAVGTQPTITLTSPTANETAMANILATYGLCKVVTQ